MKAVERQRSHTAGELALPDNEVHVWQASTAGAEERHARFAALLSPDERTRAQRFYFEADRARFILVRGMLRRLLGRYTRIDPAQVEFSYGEFGKPEVKFAGGVPLRFSVSHSGDVALFAFTGWRRVGVDVERVRAMSDTERFAAQLFAASESALLSAVGQEKSRSAFFQLWTAKEAFLKAVGMGLTMPLDRVEVELREDESLRLAALDGDVHEAQRWQLGRIDSGPEYKAALVVEGQGCRVLPREL